MERIHVVVQVLQVRDTVSRRQLPRGLINRGNVDVRQRQRHDAEAGQYQHHRVQ